MLQTALPLGCSTFSVELTEKPTEMVCEQHAKVLMCTRLWGVRMGDVELEHPNILDNRCLNEVMARTDVVLVNNNVFGEKREYPPPFVFHSPLEIKGGIEQLLKQSGANSWT